MSPRRFPDLPGGSAPLPGTPGRAGEESRPGTDPALPVCPPAGGAEGGTPGSVPVSRSRSAPGGLGNPRPAVRRTQTSTVPAVPASGTATREGGPGAAVRTGSGTAPETPAGGDATRAAALLAGQGTSGPPSLAYTATCAVCGTVPCETMAEADKRAERHTKVTRHPTVAKAVAS